MLFGVLPFCVSAAGGLGLVGLKGWLGCWIWLVQLCDWWGWCGWLVWWVQWGLVGLGGGLGGLVGLSLGVVSGALSQAVSGCFPPIFRTGLCPFIQLSVLDQKGSKKHKNWKTAQNQTFPKNNPPHDCNLTGGNNSFSTLQNAKEQKNQKLLKMWCTPTLLHSAGDYFSFFKFK